MEKDVLSFSKVKVNHDLLDEIWTLDPRTIDTMDGVQISSYAVCLSQYLIYFGYQRNITKAEVHRLTKYIDRTVSLIMSSGEIDKKKYKTKAAAEDYIISMNMELMNSQSELEKLQIELIHVEGMEKHIGELIATLKRELTRRENELYRIRQERK
jgi:hypothetical protein